jgi:hypothetical protein
MGRTTAKRATDKKHKQRQQLPLDTFSEEVRRGRRPRIPGSWVRGRADNYRDTFELIWESIWPSLARAETEEDVINAFGAANVAASLQSEVVNMAELILEVVRDPNFPRRDRQAQIRFLADSIAGFDTFTPRSSRDICERERARINRAHRIISYEYYIECSCGYKGTSRNHACPTCGAEIQFPLDSSFGIYS